MHESYHLVIEANCIFACSLLPREREEVRGDIKGRATLVATCQACVAPVMAAEQERRLGDQHHAHHCAQYPQISQPAQQFPSKIPSQQRAYHWAAVEYGHLRTKTPTPLNVYVITNGFYQLPVTKGLGAGSSSEWSLHFLPQHLVYNSYSR